MLAETGLVLDGPVLGDIQLGGALLLTEGTPSDICITWRAHHSSTRILITAVLDETEIRGPDFQLPRAITAVDMCEYLTEIDDGKTEARLAFFVLTEGHQLYRFSIAHPGLYGGAWPPAPEPESSYSFTKVPASSNVVALVAVNAFTGLVAFSCGSIVYATIHPEIQADPSQREFDLNPPRSHGLLRSFVFGDGNQRPVPVSLTLLPYTVVNNVDHLEHEISVVAVLCSDGCLRLWNVAHTRPFASYRLADSIIKARMAVESVGQNQFCVVVYVNDMTLAQFYGCQLDLNPSEPEFQIQNQIECSTLPIVDFRISRDRLWAVWATPEGYSIQYYPIFCGMDQSSSNKGWTPVLSQVDQSNQTSSVAPDAVQYAESASVLRQMFEYLLFGQSRYDILILNHVLCDIHRQSFRAANTYDEIKHEILSYIETSVNEILAQETDVDSSTEMAAWFRIWSSFLDDCRIFQSKFEMPISLIPLSPSSSRILICIKSQGLSQIREADVSEKLLSIEYCSQSRSVPDFTRQLMLVCNRFVAEFAVDTDYLAVVDGVFNRPESSPPSLSDYLQNTLEEAHEICASLSRIINDGLGPLIPHLEQTVRKLLNQLLPSMSSESMPFHLVANSASSPLISGCVSQIISSRYVCVRNLSVCLLFASSQADYQLPATLLQDLRAAFQTISVIRWISLQYCTVPSEFSAPIIGSKQRSITDIIAVLDRNPASLFSDSVSIIEQIVRRSPVTIGRILLRSRQFTLLFELCCRLDALSFDSAARLALLYYRGVCSVSFGHCEKAMLYLIPTLSADDDEFIRKHTDFSTSSEYAMHLVTMLTKQGRRDLALALPADEQWIFQANLALCRYKIAYEMLNAERVRDMVLAICRSGHFHLFRELPWIGFRQDVHNVLSQLASESPVTSVPDYYAILYATLLQHDDRHSAAGVMWRCSQAWHDVQPSTRETLQRECDTLAITLHTLRNCDKSEALILHRYQSDGMTDGLPPTDPDIVQLAGSHLSIITGDDVSKILQLRLVQLKLADHDLSCASPGSLSVNETVSALVNSGLMAAAVSIAPKSLLPSLFNVFVEKCLALDQNAQDVRIYIENGGVMSLSDVAPSLHHEWLRKNAWKELQQSLESVKDLSLYKLCATRILQLDQRRGQLPMWLLDRFRGSFGASETDPTWMLRLLLQYHMPGEAARFAIDCLQYPSDHIPIIIMEEIINICKKSTQLCRFERILNLLLPNESRLQTV